MDLNASLGGQGLFNSLSNFTSSSNFEVWQVLRVSLGANILSQQQKNAANSMTYIRTLWGSTNCQHIKQYSKNLGKKRHFTFFLCGGLGFVYQGNKSSCLNWVLEDQNSRFYYFSPCFPSCSILKSWGFLVTGYQSIESHLCNSKSCDQDILW